MMDRERFATAVATVEEADERLGVVGRGRMMDRIADEYDRLLSQADAYAQAPTVDEVNATIAATEQWWVDRFILAHLASLPLGSLSRQMTRRANEVGPTAMVQLAQEARP